MVEIPNQPFSWGMKKPPPPSYHGGVEAPEADRVDQGLGALGPALASAPALGPGEEALGVWDVWLGGPHVGLLQGHAVVLRKPGGDMEGRLDEDGDHCWRAGKPFQECSERTQNL